MQGYLLKYRFLEGTLFNSSQWVRNFFSLKNQILQFYDEKQKKSTFGQIHMAISMVLPEQPGDSDCDIRIDTGLVELRIRAMNIKDKIDWLNALNRSKKEAQKP